MSDSPSPVENFHWLVKTVDEQRQSISELEKERDAWKEVAELFSDSLSATNHDDHFRLRDESLAPSTN